MKLSTLAYKWIWSALGGVGFCIGLLLFLFAAPEALRHFGLIVMVAAPLIALRQAMKSKLAPHCPRPG